MPDHKHHEHHKKKHHAHDAERKPHHGTAGHDHDVGAAHAASQRQRDDYDETGGEGMVGRGVDAETDVVAVTNVTPRMARVLFDLGSNQHVVKNQGGHVIGPGADSFDLQVVDVGEQTSWAEVYAGDAADAYHGEGSVLDKLYSGGWKVVLSSK